MIWIFLYLVTVAAAGAIQWGEYMDKKNTSYHPTVSQKVVRLYIIPLIPIGNMFIILSGIIDHH